MTGYDFDKTIYKGDSTTDFFFYMIFSRPYLLLFFVWYLLVGLLFVCKIIGKKRFKELLFFFIPWYKNIDRIVDKFWSKNANKIADFYVRQKKEDDVIVSASLGFIIKPVVDMLNVKNLICTNFNTKFAKIIGENCYGKQKAIEFERLFPKTKLDAFYSDSLSDEPMMELAEKSFLVDGEKVNEIVVK